MCDLDLWSRFAASTEAGSIPVRPASDRRSENPIVIDFFVTEWQFVERRSKKSGGVRNFGGSLKKIKSRRGSLWFESGF